MPIDARISLPWRSRGLQSAEHSAEGLAAASAAAWFVARSRRRRVDPLVWREWLTAGAGLDADVLQRFPAGSCLAASIPVSVPAGSVACVQPVHLQTAIDHLQLAEPGSMALSEAEACAILDTLNPHLSACSMRLIFVEPMLWLLHSERAIDCETTEPVDAVGKNLRGYLPQGRDAAGLNRLLTELQMILHEHPVNVLRRERGQIAVNALWPWGFGPPCSTRPAPVVLPELHTDDPWLRGLWQLHGGPVTTLERLSNGSMDMNSDFAMAWQVPPLGDREQWVRVLEGSIFAPLKEALQKHSGARVSLRTGTAEFQFAGRYGWRPWRRRPEIDELFE